MSTRAVGGHTPARRGIAGALIGATIFGALVYPALLTAQPRLKPADLPALPSSSATGPRVPQPLNPQVDGMLPVSPSVQPTLVWKDIPEGIGQVTFTVTTLASRSPQTLWQSTVAVGSDRVAKARVPANRLEQGSTYGWGAVATSKASVKHGPFQMTVDSQRAGVQPAWSFSGLQVAEATGELVYQWQGPSIPTLSGTMGFALEHRPTNLAQVGLPQGWKLAVQGSTPWTALEANADGSVTLRGASGSVVTYTKDGSNQWRPALGRYHSAGTATLLAQNDDGTFSATDGNRTVTVFSKPTAAADAHPTKVWTLGAPTVQQAWQDGRLSSLTDPVTGNQVGFFYGGDPACANQAAPGFVTAPEGQLCGSVDAAGNAVMVEYVKTPTGTQIARLARSAAGGAAIEDLSWDAAGRIAAVRMPLAAAAVVTGAVDGVGVDDPRITTQVRYDAQGRVAGITAPAALTSGGARTIEQTGRAAEQFTYAPFTVKATGVSAPVGSITQVWTDPETLRSEKTRNESGNVTQYQYDIKGNLTRTTDVMSGTVTETRYDAQGRPVEQLGPTKGDLDGANVPKTTTRYDQDENGRPWSGLATRYWNNASFIGAPSGGTTGPIPPGASSKPATLSLNWPGSPVGEGPWSARLTGEYVTPADGAYTFSNTTSAQMWVNGSLCQPACTLSLKKGGAAPIQLDVVSNDGGPAGINATVVTPGGAREAIPTSATRPNYDMPTSTTTREHAAGGGNTTLTTKAIYNQVTTQLVATVSPSGARTTRTYEPYDPANGQWGRSTGVTDASGRTTTPTYYAQGQMANDCQGNELQQQGGVATINLPGGESVSQVTVPGGGALVRATGGGATVCGTSSADGAALTSTTSGDGAEVSTTSVTAVDGNPLKAQIRTSSRGVTTTETSDFDINGHAWATTDAQGTRVVSHANPYTGKLERVVQTTAKGEKRDVKYTYAPGGDVATITVNGHLLLTNEYAPDGALLRSRLGNGAVQAFELDANNSARKATTTFADGTVISESALRSPTGRLLSRTLSGPTGTSTFDYAYNVDGRLTSTKLEGTIPAKQVGWTNEYSGKEGAGGNRASLTTRLPSGATEVKKFEYGPGNRLTSVSSGRAQGNVEYDAAGRAVKLGKTALTYDAAGHLLSATDGERTYSFTNNGDTTTFTDVDGGTTRTVSATVSGQGLILGTDGLVDGQVVRLAPGVSVLMGANGAPARWIYDDMLGNGAWTSRGEASPTKTQLYAPDGQAISVERTMDPRTPTDLLLASMGWMNGQGASSLRLATPITVMGDRSYSTTVGRFLQADPQIGGALNAYEYAIGDPINMVDPTGHFPWGWIAGAIAAAVVGVAIGALTFGIGVGATAAYGSAALWAQIAMGAVVGAVSGMAGEMVTQVVSNPGAPFDWASIGIAAGIGAGVGALTGGVSSLVFKVHLPARQLRMLAQGQDAGGSNWAITNRFYAGVRQARVAKGQKEWTIKDVFTTKSWRSMRRAGPAEPSAPMAMDDLLAYRGRPGSSVGSSSKSLRAPSGGVSEGAKSEFTSIGRETFEAQLISRPQTGASQGQGMGGASARGTLEKSQRAVSGSSSDSTVVKFNVPGAEQYNNFIGTIFAQMS